jgi:hypothetical protein
VTFPAQNGAADLWLERNAIVLAAVIADYLESFRSVIAQCRFFRPAFRAPLRSGHVPLVKHLLIFFAEEKCFFALNANRFNVGHLGFLLLLRSR